MRQAPTKAPLAGVALALAGLLTIPTATGCKGGDKDGTPSTAAPVQIDVERFKVELFDDDYAIGGKTPLVTVVAFTDFACPPCGRSWKVLHNLVEDYGEDVRVVFRAFPVRGFGQGEQALEAAFAAGAQDKFWPMHARLFEQQGSGFERPTLRAHAEAVGVDIQKFMDDLDNGVHTSRLNRHKRQAATFGVQALPVAFVNGLFLIGFHEEDAWHGLIDEEIKRAREMLKAGTPRAALYAEIMKTAATKRVVETVDAEKMRDNLKAQQDAAKQAPKNVVRPDPAKRYAVEAGPAPLRGPEDAAVQIVEFMDFKCPFCRKAWSGGLQDVLKDHAKDVSFAVRHLPLPIHPEARGMAQAAIAAGNQGKFWPFHDAMIAKTGPVGRSDFEAVATELGLDLDKFRADMDAAKTTEILEADAALARKLGVTGTPGFFVNGLYVKGPNVEAIRERVEADLAEAKKAGKTRAAARTALMADAVPESDFPNP